jgi:transcriptional regulator with XRE-family HTH domain
VVTLVRGETVTVGENLRRLRKDKGLSVEKLAELASENPSEGKVSPAYVSRLENGFISSPSADKLGLMARVLGVSVGELIGETPPPLPAISDEEVEALPIPEAAKKVLRPLKPTSRPGVLDWIQGVIARAVDQAASQVERDVRCEVEQDCPDDCDEPHQHKRPA